MRLLETGMIKKLGDRYFKMTAERCMIRNIEAESQEGNALSLFALVSAFLILGIGVGLSLLVFGIELILFWFPKRNKSQHCQQSSKPKINKVLVTAIKIKTIKSSEPTTLNDAVENKKIQIKTVQYKTEVIDPKEAQTEQTLNPIDYYLTKAVEISTPQNN